MGDKINMKGPATGHGTRCYAILKELALIAIYVFELSFPVLFWKERKLLGGSVYGTDLNSTTCNHPCI